MKITITLECNDEKEATRTMQALSNRLDTLPAKQETKTEKTIVEPKKEVFHSAPPLLTREEPTAEQIGGNGEDGPLNIPDEQPIAVEASDKPWTRKFPDGCRHCGTKEKNHMGKGLCTTCYFPHRGEYA